LKAWCDSNIPALHEPYVWKFPKNGGDGQKKAPHNIFSETDFYTIFLRDGSRDLRLEHGLATLESNFCRIREKRIVKREPLDPEEKVWFCAFAAAMHFRTRRQRSHFQRQWGHVVEVAGDLQGALAAVTPEQRRRNKPPTTLGETVGPPLSISDVKVLADRPIQNMLPTMIAESLPILARMNLAIFTTEDDIGFVTSDHPCVWFDPEGGRWPPRLRSRTIEVFMPVSPSSLAVLCWEAFPSYRNTRLPEVDEANRFQQISCEEHFIVRRNATKSIWFS
jgi:hypothetical protein